MRNSAFLNRVMNSIGLEPIIRDMAGKRPMT